MEWKQYHDVCKCEHGLQNNARNLLVKTKTIKVTIDRHSLMRLVSRSDASLSELDIAATEGDKSLIETFTSMLRGTVVDTVVDEHKI